MKTARATSAIEGHIRAARDLLRPTPVRLHHVPRWFSRCLGPLRIKGEAPWQTLSRIGEGWLDHWGSSVIAGVVAFVSEPYGLGARGLAAIAGLTEATGMEVSIKANSWHYPGSTVRIEFRPPEEKP